MQTLSDPTLLRSPWPAPVADGYGRALDFHLSALARWLDSAGAEPRLALVLCSGPAARDRFVEGIGIDRIDVVHAPTTARQPVHPAIAGHQGDHFNRTLYIVDGLEDADEGLLDALDTRAGSFARTATWAALMVESLDSLGALYRSAPRLMSRVMRRCLVLDGHTAESTADPLPERVRRRWRAPSHLAEQIYHHAMTPKHAPALLDFDRLARTGYLPALVGRVMHPERQRLTGLWSAGPDARALPFTAEQAGPAAAEAALRRGQAALDEALRVRLGAVLDPRARLAAGAPLDPGPLADLRGARAMGAGEIELDTALLARLRAALDQPPLDPTLSAHAHEALAAAAAAAGDLDGCAAGLAAAAEAADGAGLPELLFDVLEKQSRIAVFRDQRGAAKTMLKQLEALAPLLHSPFYAARTRLARGEAIQPLDPARAASEFAEAERLFRAHGHPTWAATVRESQP